MHDILCGEHDVLLCEIQLPKWKWTPVTYANSHDIEADTHEIFNWCVICMTYIAILIFYISVELDTISIKLLSFLILASIYVLNDAWWLHVSGPFLCWPDQLLFRQVAAQIGAGLTFCVGKYIDVILVIILFFSFDENDCNCFATFLNR